MNDYNTFLNSLGFCQGLLANQYVLQSLIDDVGHDLTEELLEVLKEIRVSLIEKAGS